MLSISIFNTTKSEMQKDAKSTSKGRRRTPKVEKNKTSEREGNDEEGGGLWGDKDEGKQKVKEYNPGRGQINSKKRH